jgi:hypothetical protein
LLRAPQRLLQHVGVRLHHDGLFGDSCLSRHLCRFGSCVALCTARSPRSKLTTPDSRAPRTPSLRQSARSESIRETQDPVRLPPYALHRRDYLVRRGCQASSEAVRRLRPLSGMRFGGILCLPATQAPSLVLSGVRDVRQRVCSPVRSCISSCQAATQSVLHSFWCL